MPGGGVMSKRSGKAEYGVWVRAWPGRPKLRDRILNMYRVFDTYVEKRDEPDRLCGSCAHCAVRPIRRAHMCKRAAVPDWNWRVNWPACGLWKER